MISHHSLRLSWKKFWNKYHMEMIHLWSWGMRSSQDYHFEIIDTDIHGILLVLQHRFQKILFSESQHQCYLPMFTILRGVLLNWRAYSVYIKKNLRAHGIKTQIGVIRHLLCMSTDLWWVLMRVKSTTKNQSLFGRKPKNCTSFLFCLVLVLSSCFLLTYNV